MNNYIKVLEKISCCEDAHLRCFSECYENDQIIWMQKMSKQIFENWMVFTFIHGWFMLELF